MALSLSPWGDTRALAGMRGQPEEKDEQGYVCQRWALRNPQTHAGSAGSGNVLQRS